MHIIKKDFEEKGFGVLHNVYPREQIKNIYQNIIIDIKKCANELNCSLESYLTNVTRWLHPSPVTMSIYELAETSLKQIACHFIGAEVKLSKVNIISKSAYANGPVPCHQDIAYSRQDPYEFSLWLPLQDVTLREGALEFLPNSHLSEIKPAIDFWQPHFVDKMYLSPYWQQNFISLPVQAGDAIVFDARIWHRSARNESGHNRFAIVTRWKRVNYQSSCEIPEKIPAKFGMWTCGELTELILQQGLSNCFNLNSFADLASYICLWQERLNEGALLPFLIDIPRAKKSLNDLWILHKAAQLHNGGDAQGVVYPNLWYSFLEPVSQWLEQSKSHPKEWSHE
jgi:hypothetical protein